MKEQHLSINNVLKIHSTHPMRLIKQFIPAQENNQIKIIYTLQNEHSNSVDHML